MAKELLKDKRSDPSVVFDKLGSVCQQRAGQFYLVSELMSRWMEKRREEYENYWKIEAPQDKFDDKKDEKMAEEFAEKRSKMVQMVSKMNDGLAKQPTPGGGPPTVGVNMLGETFETSFGKSYKDSAQYYVDILEMRLEEKNLPPEEIADPNEFMKVCLSMAGFVPTDEEFAKSAEDEKKREEDPNANVSRRGEKLAGGYVLAINRPGSQTDEEATPEKTLVGDSRRQPSTTKTQEVTEPAATEEEALVESSEKK